MTPLHSTPLGGNVELDTDERWGSGQGNRFNPKSVLWQTQFLAFRWGFRFDPQERLYNIPYRLFDESIYGNEGCAFWRFELRDRDAHITMIQTHRTDRQQLVVQG